MTPEREAYLRRQHADDITPKGCETCEVFAALDEARRERDGWKDIADRRYALRSELEAALGIPHGPAESDSVEKAHARLRAILDERDAARAEEQVTRARWQSSLVSLRTGTLERERDAALAREARLRAAAERAITMIGWDGGEARRDLEAAIEADDTATTWLADRERAAALQAAGAAWAIAAPDRQVDSSALVEVVDRIMAARKEGT